MEKSSMTMGAMIASLRKKHHMTQAELAEKLHVTDKAVSKWEQDLCCPDTGTIPDLANALGVSVDTLFQCRVPDSPAVARGKRVFPAGLILKAVSLAMGVAVAVSAALCELDSRSGFVMLGIGLACTGIAQLRVR